MAEGTFSVETDTAFGSRGVVVGGDWHGLLFPAPDAESDGLIVPRVLIRPDDGGPALIVPSAMLEERGDGTFYLPLDRAATSSYAAAQDEVDEAKVLSGERIVVPVLAETVTIGRRWVETGGGVRVTKRVRERTEVLNEALARDEVTVERVSVNRIVDAPPPTRQEGDTMIIPLLEEVLVVEKRLLLREEVRIARRRHTVREPQTVVLREEEAQVERLAPSTGGASDAREGPVFQEINPGADAEAAQFVDSRPTVLKG